MRIVIISCSSKKRIYPQPMPAIEVYDGPYYKTMRKLIREEKFPKDVRILIISAMYGVLNLNDPIEYYDFRITAERARYINQSVLAEIRKYLDSYCEEIVINLGADYLPAIDGIEGLVQEACRVRYITGTVIQRRKKLKEYLTHG